MYLKDYENIILRGDFNSPVSEITSKFCQTYNLCNLITEPTCYKNPNNPSSIDVILTNRKNTFENSTTIETELSDHHKMIFTTLKSKFKWKDLKVVNFRCYNNFDENSFREELKNSLENIYLELDYENFKLICMTILF